MGVVSGTVKESGTPVAGRVVRLYRRDTGALLGDAFTSDGTGSVDPTFENVSLLLHCDGSNGSTFIVDSGSIGHTLTASGGASISTSDKKFGSGALYVPAAGTVTAPASASFDFGAGDFTVDAFVKTTQTVDAWMMGYYKPNPQNGTQQGWILLNFSGTFYLDLITGSDNIFSFGPSSGVADGAWHHIAATRASGVVRCFLDGALMSTATFASTINTPTDGLMVLGGLTGTFEDAWSGLLDEVRVKKGEAIYTGPFTPPSAPHPDTDVLPSVGQYKFKTDYTGEVQVVCLDDAAGTTYNDLIARTTPA